ncbi:MAG TPA: aminoglycoside phosphotransferase family protein [Streptosporangiaceae bacterium]|nr:aminoglycoside phosphotransferase family protein [Streptosporangiaceae bacterium]
MTSQVTASGMLSPASVPAPPADPDLRALLGTPGSRVILLDASRDPNAGVMLLVTAPGATEPHLAVKIATTAAAAEVIEREARLLVELRLRPLPRVDETLPRHIGIFDADGMLASATTVVPGIPMRTSYHAFRHSARPDSVRRDFAAAQNWLMALHADSMAAAAPIALLDGVAARIAARWPDDPRALDLAERLEPLAARLASAGTRRTVVHGDFWAGNLLISRDAVTGVVDWAAAELSGEPLRDVVRFVFGYSLYLDRHTRPGRPVSGHPGLRADGWGAGIRYGMSGEGWYGHLVRDFVESALARLGAPAGLWRAALLAGLGEIAATADHADFALCHRDLLCQLISEAL